MRNRRTLALVAGGIMVAILVPIILTIAPIETGDGTYHLQYSLSPRGNDPIDLDGATVRGDIYPVTTPDTSVEQVEFSLDGEFVRTEDNPPFDFGGGSARWATSWDTTTVSDGPHTIEAVLTLEDGSATTTSATFIVANNPSDPTPPPTSTTAPEDVSYSLSFSLFSDRNLPVALDNATVGGLIYVFTAPDTNVTGVEFFLDDIFVGNESNPPFDFISGDVTNAAAWDTTEVANGQHTIKAILSLEDGSVATLVATFTIMNDEVGTDPTPTATTDPADPTPTSPADDETYDLQFSLFANRNLPIELEGASVVGQIYVFLEGDEKAEEVNFYLDEEHVKTESIPPYDFAGGAANRAIPWNTGLVNDGQHTIKAVVGLDDDTTSSVAATFTVANNGGGPNVPTSTPSQTATPVSDDDPPPTATSMTPGEDNYSIDYSFFASRTIPLALDGSTILGDTYIFISPDSGIDEVQFLLDGDEVQFERNPPFDFAGGTVSRATGWNTSDVDNGAHTIEAVLSLDDDTSLTISATFIVDNDDADGGGGGGEGPTVTPPAGPDPNPDVSDLTLIPTYHSISVYAPYSGSAETLAVEWRRTGGDWVPGQNLIVVPGDQQARGSLVGMTPGTTYDVRVGNQTESVTTWSEQYPVGSGETYYVDEGGSDNNPGTLADPFASINRATSIANPGDTILVRGGEYEPFEVTRSGTESAYIDVRAYPGETPVVTSSGTDTLVKVSARYLRIAGFEVVGGNKGIQINSPSQFVVIDDNFIHDQIYTGDTEGPVTIGDSFSSQNSVANITFQNNTVYAVNQDPAQAAVYVKGTSGGHVIRNNEVYFFHDGETGTHGTDCFGGGPNFASHGGFHRDTDVYNNYCEGATDDAISADGGGMNVRIWGNVSTGSQTGLSIAPVILGPVYYFRNVTYDQEVHWVDKCAGVKTGENSNGTSFIYHNVWITTNAARCDGKIHGFSNDGGGETGNVIARNNIIHVTARIYSKSSVRGDYNLHFSEMSGDFGYPLYDCCGTSAGSLQDFQDATGRDINSVWGAATFGADYRLASGSLGLDAGVVLPGFNDGSSGWPYQGSAPDMGAYEQ